MCVKLYRSGRSERLKANFSGREISLLFIFGGGPQDGEKKAKCKGV